MTSRLWLALPFLAAVATAAPVAWAQAPPAPPPPPASAEVAAGRDLYVTGCSSCHGLAGTGGRLGPTLRGVGAASVDFYLTTGRMPLAEPQAQARRKKPAYTPREMSRLVAYVVSLSQAAGADPGPPVPEVDPDGGDLTLGNQLYAVNCAGCHNSAGSGGALGQAVYAPAVTAATPVQVAEAVRIGPGAMPVFGPDTLSDHEVASIVRYVGYLDDPRDVGGAPLGRVGPIAEGLVAWVVGVGALLVFARWIGTTT